MNKLVAPFAALAFAFSMAIAHADEAAGKIAAADAGTLILEDGTTFTLAEGVSMEGLEPGTEVTEINCPGMKELLYDTETGTTSVT